MVRETKIPEGYKQTEVGVIPEDWEVKRCGDLGAFYKGKGISSKDLVDYGLPCIMYGDIYVKFDTFFSSPDFRITQETANKSSLAKTDDLFFTGSGETAEEIGKCVVYQGDEDIFIGGDIIGMRPHPTNDSLFLSYLQNSYILISQKTALSQGHTVAHIYTKHIKSLLMPLPPTIEEQQAIAEALGDVDGLIGSLDKLIAKKRNIKQGTMQKLLTGKKRLPGFNGEWEVKKLGEISNIKTGSRNNQDKVEDGEYPFYVRSDTVERINSYSYDCEAILIPGEGGIGNIFHYIKGRFDVHQRVYSITNFNSSISGKYVYYFIKQNFGNHALKNTVKATVDSLRLPTFQNFEVVTPPDLQEQISIVDILSDMDAELEALEQKRHKYKSIKQGMMQELLTGRTRLI